MRPLLAAKVDTLVLGCTHYPLIKPLLSRVLGSTVRLIDSAEETAAEVVRRLAAGGLAAPQPQRVTMEIFIQLGAVFERQKRFAEAERMFREVLAMDAANTRAWEELHDLGARF